MVKKHHPRPKKNPSKPPVPFQEHADQDHDLQAQAQEQQQQQQQQQEQELHALRAQQRLLDIFAHAFLDVLAADDFPQRLRDVKQALFDRDFAAAFGTEDRLQVYAARYSPTRALCYASILQSISAHLETLQATSLDAAADFETPQVPSPDAAPDPEKEPRPCPDAGAPGLRILAIGGCAAEHVAVAAHLHSTTARAALTLVDSAPWAPIAALLQDRITSPPLLSKYASAAARSAALPLLDDAQLSTVFAQHDVLSLGADRLRALTTVDGAALTTVDGAALTTVDGVALTTVGGGRPVLVTLMFTLNELYTTQGIGKTTAFLGRLGDVVPPGSLLLVVDSPGSYSEAAVGREKKKYPMQWLLDHTLLHTERGSREAPRWSRLESLASVWFRLPEALTYPIQLENMRYQMHLYRREDIAGGAQV